MRAKSLIIIHALLLSALHAVAAFASGEDVQGLLRFAPPVSALGRGGCGISIADSDLFTSNPAAIGGLRRWALGAAYGSGDGRTDQAVDFACPVSLGVLGISARYYRFDGAAPEGAYAFQSDIGAAKELYPGLYLGAALHATSAVVEDERIMYGALHAGVLAHIGGAGPSWRGLGFFGLTMGASLRTGGGSGGSEEMNDFDRATAGLTINLYRRGIVTASLAGEASAVCEMEKIAVKSGIESVIGGHFIARAGWIARDQYGMGRYTLGAGLRFDLLDVRGDMNYAFLSGDGSGGMHYFGMTVARGGPDTRPPEISATADCAAFSPNFDGRQDRVNFRLRGSDESDIKGWFFQVLTPQGRVVKEYRHHGRGRRRSLSPLALARALVETRESGVIPGELAWDGMDAGGRAYPDGEYLYSFVTWDDRDNISAARKGRIFIDTVSPAVTMAPVNTHLVQAGGNPIEIEIRVRDQNEDRVLVSINDERNGTVRRFNWVAHGAPSRIVWDGKDEDGKLVKPGRYTCVLTVRDEAGNSVSREIGNLVVEAERRRLDVTPAADYYSPVLKKPLLFRASYEKGLSSESWKFLVLDAGGETVRFLQGGGLPASIEWDGLAGNGRKPRDGVYLCRLEVTQKDGALLSSAEKRFVVDSTPPEPYLDADSDTFTPDGDFNNDFMTFTLESDDDYGTGRWELNLRTESGALYCRVSGEGEVPRRLTWDGSGKGASMPFSMEGFTAELVATDRAGNRSAGPPLKFSTDIMLLPWQGMLRITFADSSDASRLRGDARLNRALDRLADVLGDYPGYGIEIESHSDFEGEDAVNLASTEKKAKYVRDFLVRRGFGDREISFRGMGETRPMFGEDAGPDRKKNGRIELFLTPKAN